MSTQISEQDIQKIVQSVLQNVEAVMKEIPPSANAPLKMKQAVHPEQQIAAAARQETSTIQPQGDLGVFASMEDAVEAGHKAQLEYMRQFQLKDRERIVSSMRQAVLVEKENLANMVYEETKLGNVVDKIAKHELTALHTPGTEILKTEAFSGDDGLTIVEEAPFGLIGAVTPVTNPTETILNNSIGMLAAGNAVVFNVHPSSKNSCAYMVRLLNKAIKAAGGPENLITMVGNPTLDTMQVLIESPKVRMLVGTGGPGLVKTLLKSGKKAVGAGAGNPPVIVDDTADLEHAAKSIIDGASFDNNILCIAEKEVFVLDSAADDLVFHMLNNGAYMLDQYQLEKVMSFALEENEKQVAQGCSLDSKREYHVAKKWVGQPASAFLKELGVVTNGEVRLLICDVEFDHPFVQLEQMMPVLPLVRTKSLDEAIDFAVKAEHGNRHTAIMHSKNVDHLTRFARAVETTIFVKNASSLAGVGFGGEGFTTMTIAGPTGEGITSAKTFTRQRRCVLAEGGFRIIG
ncbi:aldehyde dehydrogenase EutE [Mesobacillus subterraneus]|uniref:aldehyde dehydrogenase family protein n=1 Tax=Mesobacillus subterraneus TaxID=285983 RepID=UPI001CFD66FB|nr:aldehyde dehydrogenase family protein [Mesobacillus subterraneus]WLR55408.1 aldehyde dehydrogenase EutE [Mesobacillus subterraneus]